MKRSNTSYLTTIDCNNNINMNKKILLRCQKVGHNTTSRISGAMNFEGLIITSIVSNHDILLPCVFHFKLDQLIGKSLLNTFYTSQDQIGPRIWSLQNPCEAFKLQLKSNLPTTMNTKIPSQRGQTSYNYRHICR